MAVDSTGVAGRLPSVFMTPGSSSFTEFLSATAPHLLPGGRPAPATPVEVAHGTTIVAVTFPDGVIMAGDRRATMGNMIAQRDVEKVFHADEYSCVGYAGTAGVGAELIRLFQVELEHYEKIEGTTLSLEAKANRLNQMVKENLPMAMQGLAVIPMFAGYDLDSGVGRIFSYDVAGARAEEKGFHAVGSGSVFARGALKKRYRADARRRDGRTASASTPSTTPPTTTPPPADRTWPGASTRWWPPSRRTGSGGSPTTRWAAWWRSLSPTA